MKTIEIFTATCLIVPTLFLACVLWWAHRKHGLGKRTTGSTGPGSGAGKRPQHFVTGMTHSLPINPELKKFLDDPRNAPPAQPPPINWGERMHRRESFTATDAIYANAAEVLMRRGAVQLAARVCLHSNGGMDENLARDLCLYIAKFDKNHTP